MPHDCTTKTCTKCGETKPLDQFPVDKHSCIVCQKAYLRQWRLINAESVRLKKAQYYQANSETICSQSREYYKLHADKGKKYSLEYRHNHPEIHNRDVARLLEWHLLHPGAQASSALRWRLANTERFRGYVRQYKARKRGAAISDLTVEQWAEIKATYKGRCAYCGCKPKRLTQDHVTPLSKGGNHTASNIVPVCQPCNNKKYVGPAPIFQRLLV